MWVITLIGKNSEGQCVEETFEYAEVIQILMHREAEG